MSGVAKANATKRTSAITCVFVDIGGVLLTNGWDHHARRRSAKRFKLVWTQTCFVHLRKPDADIFRMALDIAQSPVRQIVYIENTSLFVRVAEGLGIRGIIHTDYQSTSAKLASLGLSDDERVSHE